MKILCTDLEGTLAPEIWQEIANEYQIKDLQLTTREIPDFEELMQTKDLTACAAPRSFSATEARQKLFRCRESQQRREAELSAGDAQLQVSFRTPQQERR